MKKLALKELSADLRELYDAALAAREHAYIPYSHFAVGALRGGRLQSPLSRLRTQRARVDSSPQGEPLIVEIKQ